MIPILFQVVGEEDYALKIRVESSGAYVVESGSYSTAAPRKGQLTDSQEAALLQSIDALGTPSPHPIPEGGSAFQAQLTIGAPGEEVDYAFWEGALEEDPELAEIIRRLELL